MCCSLSTTSDNRITKSSTMHLSQPCTCRFLFIVYMSDERLYLNVLSFVSKMSTITINYGHKQSRKRSFKYCGFSRVLFLIYIFIRTFKKYNIILPN